MVESNPFSHEFIGRCLRQSKPGSEEAEDHLQRARRVRRGLHHDAAQVLSREPNLPSNWRFGGKFKFEWRRCGAPGDGPGVGGQVELPLEHGSQPQPGAAVRLRVGGVRKGKEYRFVPIGYICRMTLASRQSNRLISPI